MSAGMRESTAFRVVMAKVEVELEPGLGVDITTTIASQNTEELSPRLPVAVNTKFRGRQILAGQAIR
jgi:hypothetical protein